MPKIKFRSSDSEGWQPLPKGDYLIQYDKVVPTTSKKGNPQLEIDAHIEGGDHDGKKIKLWVPMMAKTGWRVEEVLDAAGVDYTKEPTDELDDEGKPVYEYEFDPDELVECAVLYEVTIRKYEGKDTNEFKNPRNPNGDEASGADEGEEEEEEEAEEAPAPPKQTAKEKAAAAAGGATPRRRRVK